MKRSHVGVVGAVVVILAASPARGLAQSPTAQLNHLIVTVDSASHRALSESAFVTDTLGTLRTATVSDGASTWTAAYLLAEDMYLEIYAVPDASTHAAALVLGVDAAGELGHLGTAVAERGGPSEIEVRRRTGQDGSTVPWFAQLPLTTMTPTADFRVWVMEYRPEFMRTRLGVPASTPEPDVPLSRRAYLSRGYDPSKALRAVTGVELELNGAAEARLIEVAGWLGWAGDSTDDPASADPGFTVAAERVEGRSRVRAVELELGGPVPEGVRVISPRLRIRVVGGFARIEIER